MGRYWFRVEVVVTGRTRTTAYRKLVRSLTRHRGFFIDAAAYDSADCGEHEPGAVWLMEENVRLQAQGDNP